MQPTFFEKLKIGTYCVRKIITSPTFSDYAPDKTDAYCANPYPVYDRLLSDKKIFFAPKLAAWVVGGDLNTIKSLMHNPKLSIRFPDWRFAPQKPYEKMTDLEQVNANLLMSMSAENHSRVRRLASPAFNPRQVENLTADIQAIIDTELDRIEGPFNLHDLTSTIPLYALAEYIGVPRDYQSEFAGLTESILSSYDPNIKVSPELALSGLKMIRHLIGEKKLQAQQLITEYESLHDTALSLDDYVSQHTKEFLTSLMVKVLKSDEGQKITEEEALSLVASALAAGADTTLHHINWAYRNILLHPQVIPEILADESGKTLNNAIMEAYRWDNFAHSGSARFALEDIEIFGQKIEKGEMIRPMNCAMMRDPRMFENPSTYDIHRTNLKDVVLFGIGPHYCLGAAMASKITELTIGSLLRRFPQATMISEPELRDHFIARYMTRLMIDPGL
ncbi:Epothilone C/D epoxidase [BD1-7 clade bacterium]|uniref:Epothilone C/D epoxidase n=1 Tax=BD1-7 clade bacterium TaxID=2029982 RepID=A0A5S9QGZ3_9GAMM|nr:Epothilone C/D epoxidase [BD1-7 clade bacterium]